MRRVTARRRRAIEGGTWRRLLIALAATMALAVVVTVAVSSQAQHGGPGGTAASVVPVPATGTISPPRSPRNANYTIDAKLDPAARTLTATSRIDWRNITSSATSELQFHLYWNAWKDVRSTFLRERALASRVRARDADFARLDIEALAYRPSHPAGATPAPLVDLRSAIRFIAPDDGNADDRTVMAVSLPAPVGPGEGVTIELKWSARVPRPFARTGVVGDFYFMAQWFPKLGVLEEGSWNCHQFHAATEFFSDYGSYDVGLTLPTGWVVGATGVERARQVHGDGTTTHRYYQDDVHDFAWTASPAFIEKVDRFDPPGGPSSAQPAVALRLLIVPEHEAQADRYFRAARTALRSFSEWFGVYPYDQLTIVDPAFQSQADGMEYPTLITGGTSWIVPSVVTFSTPEEVVIHEVGHQFFYGIVGTNEFEDAWMDEGINTYATARALLEEYGTTYHERRYFGGVLPWTFRDLVLPRETVWNRLPGYRRAPAGDVPSAPSYRYHPTTGRLVTYNKTALWLNTLERHLGWPAVQRVLAEYMARWQFKHPKPSDFFAVATEVTGQDLGWFFDQVYRSERVFDYGIDTFKSTRDGERYRTDLIVRRYGSGVFPVEVVVTLEDGERITERWDGRDLWRHFRYDRDTRARTAQVDPRRVLLLDVNYTNNSHTLAPKTAAAATKWSLKWLVWLQDLMLTWAWLA